MASTAAAYRELPDIDDVPPLDDTDRECLEAIREILRQHGKLDRLGVALLHSHFAVHEGEVLLESCDPEARTLTIEVKSEGEIDSSDFKETAWRLSDGTVMLKCLTGCVKKDGSHRPKHVTVAG